MTVEEFDAWCGSLPVTTFARQWGGAHVWKVGGKVFAIGGWNNGEPGFTFKVSKMSFELMKDEPGLRPAPYLASRGMSWIQHYASPGLVDEDLRAYLRHSHQIVSSVLTKKTQRELGLTQS